MFSYQRLRKPPPTLTQAQELELDDDDDDVVQTVKRRSSWLRLRLRRGRLRRGIRIARLRRVLKRKARVVGSAVRKVVRRLKEGRPHLGELFAGSYLFMPVRSTNGAIKLPDKYSFLPGGGQYHHTATAAAANASTRFSRSISSLDNASLNCM